MLTSSGQSKWISREISSSLFTNITYQYISKDNNNNNNNNNILYLFTIKSGTSAPFTGDYKSANF